MYYRAADEIFKLASEDGDACEVTLAALEIHNDQVRDIPPLQFSICIREAIIMDVVFPDAD